jgi:hypothetical protein
LLLNQLRKCLPGRSRLLPCSGRKHASLRVG